MRKQKNEDLIFLHYPFNCIPETLFLECRGRSEFVRAWERFIAQSVLGLGERKDTKMLWKTGRVNFYVFKEFGPRVLLDLLQVIIHFVFVGRWELFSWFVMGLCSGCLQGYNPLSYLFRDLRAAFFYVLLFYFYLLYGGWTPCPPCLIHLINHLL